MCYVKNAQKVGDTVVKTVVWSAKTNAWAAVSTAARGRPVAIDNGTFQIIETGDILITSTVLSGESTISVQEVVNTRQSDKVTLDHIETKAPLINTDIGRAFESITNSLWMWLRNTTDSDGFLPPGIGWDGQYSLYDQRKRDRIKTMLYGLDDEMLVSAIIQAGQISSGAETPTAWSSAVSLPHTLPCMLDWDVNKNSVLLYAVSWTKDNRTDVVKIEGEDIHSGLEYQVDPKATKVLIGTINTGSEKDKHLTRWRIYTR